MVGGRCALLSRHRKWLRWCALLVRWSVFSDQVRSLVDVHSQELGALDDLHSSALYEERSVGGLVPLEVNDDLLCFVDIQVQIVQFASVHQMFHLLSVCQLFITPD